MDSNTKYASAFNFKFKLHSGQTYLKAEQFLAGAARVHAEGEAGCNLWRRSSFQYWSSWIQALRVAHSVLCDQAEIGQRRWLTGRLRMDLKGHIKRHSAIISDKAALVEGSDRIAGKENKRPLQDNGAEIENEKTEKKARLERTGGDNLLGGWQDDCVLLTRQPGEQLLPRNENSLDHDDDVVVTGVSGLWASELPHSRDQCAKFPFLKKTSTDNKNCCKQVSIFLNNVQALETRRSLCMIAECLKLLKAKGKTKINWNPN